jgi:hypothetical protein
MLFPGDRMLTGIRDRRDPPSLSELQAEASLRQGLGPDQTRGIRGRYLHLFNTVVITQTLRLMCATVPSSDQRRRQWVDSLGLVPIRTV